LTLTPSPFRAGDFFCPKVIYYLKIGTARAARRVPKSQSEFFIFFACILSRLCYNRRMKTKARVNPQGYMGSASREHKVKKGKGSFRRQKKHKKSIDY
jgi:hypothetical protein